MRIFYEDEGPIDTLLQIAAGPVRDGDLIGKPCRDTFVKHGWVAQCHGFNVVTPVGENVVRLLGLRRPRPIADVAKGKSPFAIRAETDGSVVTQDGIAFGSSQKDASSIARGDVVRWLSSAQRYVVLGVEDGVAWFKPLGGSALEGGISPINVLQVSRV